MYKTLAYKGKIITILPSYDLNMNCIQHMAESGEN
jgi:hypothetical protein